MVYIIVIFISMLFAYTSTHVWTWTGIYSYEKKNISILFMILSYIPLILVSAFRDNIGTDYRSYYYIYSGRLDTERFEQGFLLFNKILNTISHNPRLFFIASSIVICGIYITLIYKYSINPAFSLLLFLINRDYTGSFNTVRMYMAIVIAMLAIPYIIQKKSLMVVIITAIAMSFHVSAIIIIPLYILYSVNITPGRGLLIIILAFFCTNFIFRFARWFTLSFTGRSTYFDEQVLRTRVNFSWTDFLIYLSFFLLISYVFRKGKHNPNIKLAYASTVTGMIITISGTVLSGTLVRLAYFLNPILAIFTPEIIQTISKKNLRIVVTTLIVIFYAIIWVWVVFYQDSHLIPYSFSWN